MFTVTDALALHGITVDDSDIVRRTALTGLSYGQAYSEALADEARARGIIRVCLGCGTVAGVADGTPEYERARVRDVIDWEDAPCDSLPECEDADTVLY